MSWQRIRALTVALLVLVLLVPVTPAANAGDREQEETVNLQLLAINDLHGALEPRLVGRRPAGGAVALSGYLREWEKRAKQEDNAITLRVGAGDMIGASPPVSALLQDEPTIESLSLMDLDYSAVGNHEFDEGLAELRRLQFGGCHPATGCFKGAKFRYLAANVIEAATGEPAFPPYVVHNVREIPVGFIGVVLEGAAAILTPTGRAGLEFRNEVTTVNRYVAELKAQGVRAIVVLIHQGGSLSRGVLTGDIVPIVNGFDAEVDVVVSAHTHRGYSTFVGTKLVTQAFSSGTAFADIDLVLNRATGDVAQKRASVITTFADVFPGNDPDKNVQRLFEEARAIVAPIIDRVVGTAADDITRTETTAGESELGNLIADAQRARTGAGIAFMNPGGIRTDILAGEVTYGELFEVQPFANQLVTMTLSGSQVERLLEQQFTLPDRPRVLKSSGITYRWAQLGCVVGQQTRCSAADRVLPADVSVGGEPLDLARNYRVTVNSFLAFGGDNFTVLLEGTDRVFAAEDDLAALVSYIEALTQPFNAVIEGRIQLR